MARANLRAHAVSAPSAPAPCGAFGSGVLLADPAFAALTGSLELGHLTGQQGKDVSFLDVVVHL